MDLIETRDRVQSLPALSNRLEHMDKKIKNARDEVDGLLRKYEKENRDVEQMLKESFSAFLYRLVGKYEDKLDKEQREEINAKLNYDRAVTHLDSLERERDDLASRISVLREEERNFQNELAKRRQALNGKLTEPEGIRYAELEKERNVIISQITEIKEALSAAARAKQTAYSALESLKKAQGWATYDAISRGGIISHMAKYSHIDSAEQEFSYLSSQLRDLKSEINDVHGLSVSGLTEISSGQRAIDFWFDNIFTDLSVRGQIIDNADEIRRLIKSLEIAEYALNSRMKEEDAKFSENSSCEEELLLGLE